MCAGRPRAPESISVCMYFTWVYEWERSSNHACCGASLDEHALLQGNEGVTACVLLLL